MGRPDGSLDPAQIREALIAVCGRAASIPRCPEYRLVGTAAAVLRGVEMPASDVDVLVRDRQSVDSLGLSLCSYPCLTAPVWLPGSRQYYSNHDVDGVEVGFSTVEIETEADTIETYGRGPWEHYSLVTCGPYQVPAVVLELRLITELLRERQDRYRPLVEHMRLHGCDLPYLRRGFAAARLSAETIEEAEKALRDAPFCRIPSSASNR